jgi:hypothetical protein
MRLHTVGSSVAATLTLVLCGLQTGHAQLNLADAVCRREIGKAAKKLADTLLKEKVKCHKARMAGTVLAATDCNDPLQLPGALRVAKAEAKLDEKIGKKCAGASSSLQNGYVLCPSPCESIGVINGYSGGPSTVAACIKCSIESTPDGLDWTAINSAYGSNPPIPGSSSDARTKCQTNIGNAVRKYFSTRVKEQQKCQYTQDLTPSGADCRVAQTLPDQKVSKALIRAKQLIAKCSPVVFPMLTSCSTTAILSDEQNCIQATVETYADSLFEDIYFPLPDAVFVSSAVGSPSGDGSVLNPFDTISAGMTYAAANSKPKVFIDGVSAYTETLTLASNVHLQGGYNSSNGWQHDGTTTNVFSGSTTALSGTGASNSVVEELNIHAANATGTGNSSYGVRLINPAGVTITNCTITAGNGSAGSAGSSGSSGAVGGGGGTGSNGCENSSTTCGSCGRPSGGGGGTNASCSGTSGGAGGRGGSCSLGYFGEAGGAGSGTSPGSSGTGGGGCHGVPGPGGNAGAVGNGSDGAGASNFGSFGTTYVPANGSSGALGQNGSGGGGGGGGGGGDAICDSDGGGGGGGGSGGCRGNIATGGTGAGGSFGIWVSGGTATIDTTTINTGTGGTGGIGGTGGPGGAGAPGGGAGSGSDDSIPGAIGGGGGNGGRGGHGGGGGGGPSIGIVCGGGASVARSGNTITTGNGGAGGSSAGNAGATGLKTNESC